ncbi:AraC family transcriptional regulator [Rhizobium sp. TRM95111]|uniref:AraC family transcriptional regulator n=1 Tax=Rhizobium alarense TaxID=2846851 RepID=UPI001F282BD8|nr:AraC family transcriptional regulator [Rhizobium alarense]MCF3641910.1 AraC family transcriptional regulator [Rhizobium alarense]
MEKLAELNALIAHHAPADGTRQTALPALSFIRSNAVSEPLHTLYDPSFCLVAGGRKRARIGEREFVYDAGSSLVVGIDLPVIGVVTEARPDAPYLCLKLSLDRAALADLLLELDADGHASPPLPASGSAAGIVKASGALVDACVRLVHLLDAPHDIAVLAPLIEREILYRLITGSQGAILRQIANGESRLGRIGRAIDHLRRNYGEPLPIEALAGIAGMSPSSFHEHFRAATGMSPLQFRTRIRMHEARRLMVMEGLTAAEAGFRVGYESPSQFSRDHVRIYSNPPRKDLARMQAEAAL